jgi:hypothetical protein
MGPAWGWGRGDGAAVRDGPRAAKECRRRGPSSTSPPHRHGRSRIASPFGAQHRSTERALHIAPPRRRSGGSGITDSCQGTGRQNTQRLGHRSRGWGTSPRSAMPSRRGRRSHRAKDEGFARVSRRGSPTRPVRAHARAHRARDPILRDGQTRPIDLLQLRAYVRRVAPPRRPSGCARNAGVA